MSTKNTRVSAFPTFTNQYHFGLDEQVPATVDPGMTLRDYFAAKAMQALLNRPQSSDEAPPEAYASAAYLMADAMLAAREAK